MTTIYRNAPHTIIDTTELDNDFLNEMWLEKYEDIDAILSKVDGNIVLTPDTNKLVKIASIRQDITTNTYLNNIVIIHGWGFIQGDNSNRISKTVTFPITFTNVPVVVGSFLGQRDITSNPTAISDFVSAHYGYFSTRSITTVNFVVILQANDDDFSNTHRYGFSWIAIGVLT